jgi:hypothetical protein
MGLTRSRAVPMSRGMLGGKHGNFMVEVQNISLNETPPEGTDCVVIENAGNKFVANGSVAGERVVTFFKPPPFESLGAAIEAASAWAEENDVPVVYVKSSN